MAAKKTSAKRQKKTSQAQIENAATNQVNTYTLPDGHSLVLRTCNADMTSRNGFKWPESGNVEAPDWSDKKVCGQGLHGWLWGEGDATAHGPDPWASDAKWLIVQVQTDKIVCLDGKVKFPAGVVVHCGDRSSATLFLAQHGGAGRAIIGGTATAGDGGTATAGYRGTATAGYRGTATAGDGGTATAGSRGTATAGDGGTVSIRYWDEKRQKYRIAVADVGEDGIEPNTAYILDIKEGKPQFVKK